MDRRVVVNIRQARELLTGVTYVGQRGKNGRRGERLVAFYACLYFAALRCGRVRRWACGSGTAIFGQPGGVC